MESLERAIKIATLNVRGLSAKRRQNQLYRLVTEHDLDIVAIQETKVEGEDQTERMVRPFARRYEVCVAHAVGLSSGCILLIRQSLGAVVQSVNTCESGRFIVCDFSLSSENWRVICLYAPTKAQERREFFEEIESYLKCERRLILAGDFNCVCAGRDKTSGKKHNDASTAVLRDMTAEFHLEDVGECLCSGKSVIFTHFQGTSHARLDRVYVSAEFIPLCRDYSVTPVAFSDHCLVSFCVGKQRRNNKVFSWDLWKFNANLLKDDEFCKQFLEAIDKITTQNLDSWEHKWEVCKQTIKLKALERASVLRHAEKEIESRLRWNLQQLLEAESTQPGYFSEDIKSIKQKLELIDQERYKGALIRARAEYLCTGEMPTKRALGVEKKYASQNEITEIEHNGSLLTNTEKIASSFFEYYKLLFSRGQVDADRFKNDFVSLMPTLDDETKEILEVPITVEEVKEAIDRLNNGKSPGPDGLGAALYKAFKGVIAPVLTEVYNEAYEKKHLPPSFLSAHTVLIPKTEDPIKLRDVTSYRPISLTNIDYKILMKVLANRLQTVMKDLVGPHQTCGIKGRTIMTNIHIARSILECCDAMQRSVAMLQVDLEKAFDRVPHDLLLSILDYVNVGNVISEGVRMAYAGCTTRLIINKSVGERIPVQRSVRQGCPLSPLLFCIYIEPFCLSVIRNEAIRGFNLYKAEVSLLAYADDIAVFCVDHESVMHTVNAVKSFCQASGSAVNWDKCLGFWHGEWDVAPRVFMNIKWQETPTKYLGVPLQYYCDSEPYWKKQTEVLREKAQKWKGWDKSIFARATTCNIFLVSKLWYVMQVLHCSRLNVQKMHRVFAVFIWSSVWEKTSRTNLFKRVRDGGLGLVHLYVRQLVSRFVFLRDVDDTFLRTMIQLRLGKVLPEFVVSSVCEQGPVRGYLKEVVTSFRFLSVRFSLQYLTEVSRKKLYKDLVDVLFPVPLYRELYCVGPGKDVLKRVKRMLVAPGVKTFFF